MMHWNIISNINNGVGLEAHYKIIRGLLESHGHSVTGVHFQQPQTARRAGVNLFLEVVVPQLFRLAPRNWIIVHPEWWFSGWNRWLPRFDRILCLTRDAERIFRPLAGDKLRYVGFKSQDRLLPDIVKERGFIHIAGKSSTKNTEAVIDAWRLGDLPYPLLIVSQKHVFNFRAARSAAHLPEDELAREMNRRMFHLCPSAYEGFGHSLHEAMGVRGVIITTNQPPMNEIDCILPALLVDSIDSKMHHAAPLYRVDGPELARAAHAAWELPEERIAGIQARTRRRFEEGCEEFDRLFMAEVDELAIRKGIAA